MEAVAMMGVESIQVTGQAQNHFRNLLQKEEVEGMNLRISVANPSTMYAEVSVTFCPAGEEEKGDERLSFDGFRLYIDKGAVGALETAVIDFVEDELGNGQLSIKAPFLKGCGVATDSSLEEQIQYVIETEINPGLAGHGGRVSLVDIVDGKIVVLQFGGGCHGCGMAGVTLKHGIEKNLKEKFPQIVEIRDVTDHTTGENPYY